MLSSSQKLEIDLNDYGIHKFFTDENNIKGLFAVDGYEAQKASAKENIFKSLQEYDEDNRSNGTRHVRLASLRTRN